MDTKKRPRIDQGVNIHNSDEWVGYGFLSCEQGHAGFYAYFFAEGLIERKYPTIRDFMVEHEYKYQLRFIQKRRIKINYV